MRTVFKFIFAFYLVLLVSFASAKAFFSQSTEYSALIGTWDINTDVGIQMEFVFTMDADEITGELIFEMGSGTMENIDLDHNELTFFVSLDAGGQIIDVSAYATVEGDEMTGKLSSEMGDANFWGTKRIDN